MIFTKEAASSSDEKLEVLYIEYKIHNRACAGSYFYPLYIRVDTCFAVHKLVKFLSNPGKYHFKGLVKLFIYIRDNKNLGLKYFSNIDNATLSDLLR